MSQQVYTISLKAQDKLRELLSKRRDSLGKISCFSIGDSQVNYYLSDRYVLMKTIPIPYQIPDIKNKLAKTGGIQGIYGRIITFVRHINSIGKVESVYNYPPSEIFIYGDHPPEIINNKAFTDLIFDAGSSLREGYILYNQTLPDNYFDDNNNPMRYVEEYDFTYQDLPASWEVIEDNDNGSLMIAKPAGYSFTSGVGLIKIVGRYSGIIHYITFNY